MKITVNKPSPEQVEQIAAQAQEKTRGRAIIERLRGESKNKVLPREIQGETVFIKRLAWPEITRVRLLIPRDKENVLNFQNEDHLRGVTVAMLATALASSESDMTPLFSLAEAVELTDEPGAVLYVAELFNVICEVNPDVLPNLRAAHSKK